MSVTHDSCLFDPLAFASDMQHNTRLLFEDRQTGWENMRSAALELLDANPGVRWLASRYGGWDKDTIVASFLAKALPEQEALAYCFTLQIYARFPDPQGPRRLGMGLEWKDSAKALQSFGWHEDDVALVTKGRNFKDLVLVSAVFQDLQPRQIHEIADLWSRIDPISTCGSIGWLNGSDVRRLSNKLHDEGAKQIEQPQILAALLAMLASADEQETGLCIVLSG
jgi:hypothetical protein